MQCAAYLIVVKHLARHRRALKQTVIRVAWALIRLETVLELALHRSSGAPGRLLEADGDPGNA